MYHSSRRLGGCEIIGCRSFNLLDDSPTQPIYCGLHKQARPRHDSHSSRVCLGPLIRPQHPDAYHARVMLLRNHGASTLCKKLRRPIISTMSSFEGTWGLSWDAMRSSFSLFRGGRAVYVYINYSALLCLPRDNLLRFSNHFLGTGDS
jgi:hypothetical protein